MSHAPSAALKRRHDKVRAVLAERALDAIVVTSLPNVLYLTNFTGSAAIVIVTADGLRFITDFRYVSAIEAMRGTSHECRTLELVVVDGAYDVTLSQQLQSMESARVAFEADHLTVSRHRWLTSTLGRAARASPASKPAPELLA